jgi:hypothetical protein
MGFFDRFKPQPRWKHPDSVVRAAAVEALADDQQEVLEGVATTDADSEVRRAAVLRLASATALARIARDDVDERVRADAAEVLLELAQDTTDPGEAERAIAALVGQRELAIVARTAELEQAALAALSRLDDPKVVAVVARQAGARGRASGRAQPVTTLEEWVQVATKSDTRTWRSRRSTGSTTPPAIQAVAVRARSKVVGPPGPRAITCLGGAAASPRAGGGRGPTTGPRVRER